MNPQYDAQMRGQGPYMPPYNHPGQNSSNTFNSSSGPAPIKSYPPAPYGNVGFPNGPPNNYPGHNQSNSQVQSNTVPPMSHAVNNQMSQDFNAMRISQNQNHPMVTNAHPPQRLSNNMPEQQQQPPNSMGQQHYWQQPPRASPVPQGPFPNPPNHASNANAAPFNSMPYQAPPHQGNSNMPPHADRTMPPQQFDRNMPPHPNMAHPPPQSMQGQPNDKNMPQPPPLNHNTQPPAMDRNMPPPPPNHNNMERPNGHLNHMPNTFQPIGQQRQMRNASPYANGTADGMAPPSMPQQYSHLNNSNMNARYPTVSPSPVPQQGGAMPPVAGGQYGHPPNNSLQAQQNRMAPMSQQPPPARRLDPDHMPSPIQVIEDDRNAKSCSFSTAQRGLMPPLVTTNFTVIDEGLCSPRFIRSTIYNVPTTVDILKQTSVPFALSISPFARVREEEYPPPIVDPGDEGPVRCHRCRAYMSPFMQFIDAGRRFQCLLCKTTSEVPVHYFTHLDHLGQRVDKMERPELCLGSYEYIVNKDYCKEGKFPNCPAFVFLIDVSYNSIRNGMVKTVCDNMKDILSRLPREDGATESKLRVGFVTYSTAIHFYNINSNLAQPQMLVVSDVQDMFMPLLDGFLVHPSEAGHVIDSLMAQIPTMFADTRETETLLGPAIQAGMEALKAAECAGKLFVFHSTLPILEAPGKLKNRDDRKLLGTEKEKAILTPQTTFYNNLGQECVKAGCSVDLFLFNNAYIDIATIGQVCRLTGGQMYKYTYFQADIDGERFIEDLRRDVEKPIAFDCVLRLRTSTGIRPTDFTGSFFMSNTTDVELASITSDKAISIEIKYDDKLAEEEGVFIQCAVLYTSCSGQRRLRVHNLAFNSCTQMAELFRSCELDTIINVFLKTAVQKVTEESPRQIKDYFINRSAQMLGCYRKNCAQTSSAGQLILPECMKLLPLYINCLIKCDAIAGGQEMSTDDRSFIMLHALGMDVDSSVAYLYPRLLPLHELNPHLEEVVLPTALRCSIERLKDNGIYLLENGINMFLWIGLNADPEWINEVFGVPNVAGIDVDKKKIVELNTPLSQYLRKIINQLQSERQRYMKFHIVRQGDKLELLFRQQLVEDRTTDGSVSYVDFLCHLHKEIRTLLS